MPKKDWIMALVGYIYDIVKMIIDAIRKPKGNG